PPLIITKTGTHHRRAESKTCAAHHDWLPRSAWVVLTSGLKACTRTTAPIAQTLARSIQLVAGAAVWFGARFVDAGRPAGVSSTGISHRYHFVILWLNPVRRFLWMAIRASHSAHPLSPALRP